MDLLITFAAISMSSGVVTKTLVLLFILGLIWWGIPKLGLSGLPWQAMQIVIGIAVLAILIWFLCTLFGVGLP